MNKIREQVKKARGSLSKEKCLDLSSTICDTLFSSAVFIQSQHVAVYHAFRNEVDTSRIISQLLAENKQCYLPIVETDNRLSFIPFTDKTTLHTNQYGILEPDASSETPMPAKQLDLVITPLVAFDASCARIGSGAGYYDRCFSFLKEQTRPGKPFLLGLAYELQKQANLSSNAWDVPLDAVITESEIYSINNAARNQLL